MSLARNLLLPVSPHEWRLWVTSRHLTADFSTGCYAMFSGPSVGFLATVSERPEPAILALSIRASLRKSVLNALQFVELSL